MWDIPISILTWGLQRLRDHKLRADWAAGRLSGRLCFHHCVWFNHVFYWNWNETRITTCTTSVWRHIVRQFMLFRACVVTTLCYPILSCDLINSTFKMSLYNFIVKRTRQTNELSEFRANSHDSVESVWISRDSCVYRWYGRIQATRHAFRDGRHFLHKAYTEIPARSCSFRW